MDFHAIMGKLRGIESLGTTGHFVAEDATCNMTAEGEFCPVHGMQECTGYGLRECNMTAEGEHCPAHGLEECPGYAMREMEIDPATLSVSEDAYSEVMEMWNRMALPVNEDVGYANMSDATLADKLLDLWDKKDPAHKPKRDDLIADLKKPGMRKAAEERLAAEDAKSPAADTAKKDAPKADKPAGDKPETAKKDDQPAPKTADSKPVPDWAKPGYNPITGKIEPPATAGEPSVITVPDPSAASSQPEPTKDQNYQQPTPQSVPTPPPRPTQPAAANSAGYDSMTFGDAFKTARQAAGGAGGVFMYKGKPYQTNVAGEKALRWNDKNLKRVGSFDSPEGQQYIKSLKEGQAMLERDMDIRAILDVVQEWNAQNNLRNIANENLNEVDAPPPGMTGPNGEQLVQNQRGQWGYYQRNGRTTNFVQWQPPAATVTKPGLFVGGPGEPAITFGRDEPNPEFQKYQTALGPQQAPSPMAQDPQQQMAQRQQDTQNSIQTAQAPGGPAGSAGDRLPGDATGSAGQDTQQSQVAQAVQTPSDQSPPPMTQNPTAPQNAQTAPPAPPATASGGSQSFKDAFAKARKAAGGGQGVFTWNGKQYQTNVKGEPTMPVSKLKPVQVSEDDAVEEDIFGMPFTGPGATNNGPDTDGYVYANFNEGLTINTTRDMRDGKVTKTLNITATDEEAESLAMLLRNAGLGMEVMAHKSAHGMRCDGCGLPAEQCHCSEATMENADYDHGHDEKSEDGEPLEVKDYIYQGRHINQRFGKIGDNTLMAEQRAGELFKTLSEDYAKMLNEAELEDSNAGFDSPLTANNRDTFDKDPFAGEEAVTDGSRSPLSTVKRQDVMN